MLDFSTPHTALTPFLTVLLDPRARAILDEFGVVPHEELRYAIGEPPLGLFIATAPELSGDSARQHELLTRLTGLSTQAPIDSRRTDPPTAPTTLLSRGAGLVSITEGARVYERVELAFDGPDDGNPYVDVALAAIVTTPDGRSVTVAGFHAGGARYTIRYSPEVEGEYTFVVSSNAMALDGATGRFQVAPPAVGAHGPVRVDGLHFRHHDGTPFHPVGTTAYAWIFQDEERRSRTLSTLARTGFNKLRMCLTPKWFAYNEQEPLIAPFLRGEDGGYDFSRPDPEFWNLLDEHIDELECLGIQADLIFFHPYDAWGFGDMGPEADARYVAYAVARLAAHANVWWSLSNEFDVLLTKDVGDWERLGELVQAIDPSGHLRSIHHCLTPYDHSRPWVTHASLQTPDVERVTEWRAAWGKPVVIDECSYEGDLQFVWGNIDAPEMVRRHGEAATRGGYAAHGETYFDEGGEIWWSTGGVLRGTSAERLGFLRRILDETPDGGREPLGRGDAYPTVGIPGEFSLSYFGVSCPSKHLLLLDPEGTWTVDVIDTWGMSVEEAAVDVSGRVLITLPAERYYAVRAPRTR